MRLLPSNSLPGVGKEGGNSMGLILEARSSLSPFISTSLNLVSSVPFELCFVVRTESRGCKMRPVKWARLSFKTLFDDDTARIESSTYGASQTLRGVGVSLTIT